MDRSRQRGERLGNQNISKQDPSSLLLFYPFLFFLLLSPPLLPRHPRECTCREDQAGVWSALITVVRINNKTDLKNLFFYFFILYFNFIFSFLEGRCSIFRYLKLVLQINTLNNIKRDLVEASDASLDLLPREQRSYPFRRP